MMAGSTWPIVTSRLLDACFVGTVPFVLVPSLLVDVVNSGIWVISTYTCNEFVCPPPYICRTEQLTKNSERGRRQDWNVHCVFRD